MDNVFTEGMMPGPEGALLRFSYEPSKNEGASLSLGRAVFDTVLCVDIITPGQKSSTPRFEVERVFSQPSIDALNLAVGSKQSYKYAELKEWIDKFKANEVSQDLGGTPLKMWPRIDRGLAANLMAANIFTVEALANISDSNMDYIGLGAREIREQAKAWLANAAGTADMSKAVAEIDTLKLEVQRLHADLGAANTRIAELETNRAKKAAVV